MGACALYLGRREVGRLIWERCGERLQLRAACPIEPGWIYRVVLLTDKGEHRLGVMLPEGERFTLNREIPAGEVPHSALIDRTLPGEGHLPGLPLAFSAFSPTGEAPGFSEAGVCAADWMDTRYFLLRLELGKACILAHYLCLTTVLTHEGREYGIFCKKEDTYFPLSDNLR